MLVVSEIYLDSKFLDYNFTAIDGFVEKEKLVLKLDTIIIQQN